MNLDDFRQLRETPARATAFSAGLAEASINHAGAQLARVRSLSVLAGGMVVALVVVGFSLTSNVVNNTQSPASSSASITQVSQEPSESPGEAPPRSASQAPSAATSSSSQSSVEVAPATNEPEQPAPTTQSLPAITRAPEPPSTTTPPTSATPEPGTTEIPPLSPTPTAPTEPTPTPTEPTPTEPTPTPPPQIPVCTTIDVRVHSEGTFPSTGLTPKPGMQIVENRIVFTNVSGTTCRLTGDITGSLLQTGQDPVHFTSGTIDQMLAGDATGSLPMSYTEPFVYHMAAKCPITDTSATIEVDFADWAPRQVPAAARFCQV